MAVESVDKATPLLHSKGQLSKQMSQMSELHQDQMPHYELNEWEKLYWSSQIGPVQWKAIADDIQSKYLDYDGFVVLTGGDSMTYVASALSFMLNNLGKSVVLTGGKWETTTFSHFIIHHIILSILGCIPIGQVHSDARRYEIMRLFRRLVARLGISFYFYTHTATYIYYIYLLYTTNTPRIKNTSLHFFTLAFSRSNHR